MSLSSLFDSHDRPVQRAERLNQALMDFEKACQNYDHDRAMQPVSMTDARRAKANRMERAYQAARTRLIEHMLPPSHVQAIKAFEIEVNKSAQRTRHGADHRTRERCQSCVEAARKSLLDVALS
jgi:hypothetical protein